MFLVRGLVSSCSQSAKLRKVIGTHKEKSVFFLFQKNSKEIIWLSRPFFVFLHDGIRNERFLKKMKLNKKRYGTETMERDS